MADSGMEMKQIAGEAEAKQFLADLAATGRVTSVFGEPIQQGEYTVITAAEVSLSGGAGFGGGESENESGGGGGGGGFATGRPVAAIIIGRDGVRVEPIFDVTKIFLAAVSALAAVVVARGRIKRQAQTL